MYTPVSRRVPAAVLLVGAVPLVACSKKEEAAPVVQAAPEYVTNEMRQAASAVSGAYLREQITKFSADEFEGRAPATPGDTKAREYLVEQLKAIGFQPGGPDG